MIFNENIVFNRKVKDLIDNLIYSTLSEIVVYIKTIKLLLLILDIETESFHKNDESINTIEKEEDPLGYYNG